MEINLNPLEEQMLHLLFNHGQTKDQSLQNLLFLTDETGNKRLHDHKGSAILLARRHLAQMGLIALVDDPHRHDLEEGDGITRLNDDVTFYYTDLDKRLSLTPIGKIWCRHHNA